MWTLRHIGARSLVLAGALALTQMVLTGCSPVRPLAEAKGPFRPLNPGRWSPDPADLKGPRGPYSTNPSISPR